MASKGSVSAGASATAVGLINKINEKENWEIYIKDADGKIMSIIEIEKKETYREKGTHITVSKLFKKLIDCDTSFKYVYFVHCRATEESRTLSAGTFPPPDPKENKDIEKAILVVQAHGRLEKDKPLDGVIPKDLLDRIVFRADFGQLCRQHTKRKRPHVYPGAIAFHAVGKLYRPPMTDDILGLKDMEILLTHYSSHLDPKMARSGTLEGRQQYHVNSGVLSTIPEERPNVNSVLSRIPEERPNVNSGVKKKPKKDEKSPNVNSGVLSTIKEEASNIKKGGSIRKTVKKRKRTRKTKTKTRTRNRKC